VIETARLMAEPIGPSHQAELEVMLGDPRVGATLGGVLSPARVVASIEHLAAHFEQYGYGLWCWREKATGDLVARGGIEHAHVGGRDEVEVAWAVVADRWGEGFATELGAASIRAAFDEHGIDELVSFTLRHNLASRRVMEKLGFTYERDVMHAGDPHVLYRLTRQVRPGTAMPAS
jgi:[ribosomal protein S5]-alanine N-acetyltransferase